MAGVTISGVTRKFGDFTALHALDLEIREGEFLTLLGPSGCGKTTTLRLVAGFIQPTSGTIYLGADDVTGVAPQHRRIGMVFQDYALFPHMTVRENIAFGLEERRYDKHRIPERVDELLDLIRLPDMGDRYPAEVSGGQRQRIAVARAVAYPPRVLLMDEPLGALDLKLREAMQIEIRRIQQELSITTIYVTHDQTEAMNMSDRIVVMNEGVIEQLGTAEEIYRRPASRFVADFVGQINLLRGTVVADEGDWVVVEAAGARIRAAKQDGVRPDAEVSIGIRPELFKAVDAGAAPAGMNALEGRIASRTFAGNLLRVYVDIDDGKDGKRVVLEARPQDPLGEDGSVIRLGWSPDDTIVLMR